MNQESRLKELIKKTLEEAFTNKGKEIYLETPYDNIKKIMVGNNPV